MSDDGVGPEGFPPAETPWGKPIMILVILTPAGENEEQAEVRTEPDISTGEAGRALITVGEMLLADGEPGVTSTGIIIARVDE